MAELCRHYCWERDSWMPMAQRKRQKLFSLTIGFRTIPIFSTCPTHSICAQGRPIPIQDRRSTLGLPRWPASQVPRNTPHLTQWSFQSLQRMNFRAHLYKTEEREQFTDRSSLCTSFNFRYWQYHGIRQSQGRRLLNTGLWGSPKRRGKVCQHNLTATETADQSKQYKDRHWVSCSARRR